MEDSEFQKRLKSTGRNDQCLCGSGKKYKKCHLNEDERMEHEEFMKREEALKVEREVSELDKENSSENDSSGRKKGKIDKSFQTLASKSRGTKGIKSTSIPRRPAN